uniref:asialoglycoprotein receptor 1-like n=1 Tax=Gasterosteus aculeatus aculeatus TaxID=481459 RepID=UPI001A9A2AB5|nr:asialoglycoprotein receptor 1-like [Gasterosteus aculeatus aculeatus]XP_040025999.1 asialoglycoprotein receptor 1-like [Gasterosteus aculeatus aculeatus]
MTSTLVVMFVSDWRLLFSSPSLPLLAVCWILLLLIMGLRIYFSSVISEQNVKLIKENQELMKENQELMKEIQELSTVTTISDEITEMNQLRENLLAAKQELRNFSEQLNLEKEDSRKKLNSLKLQLENMTQNYNLSEGKNTKLENEIQQLKENFTKQITDLEDKWEKFNVSRAQWTIDSYCPADTSKARTCSACQKGWYQIQKSCIVLHNSEAPPDPKTWEEARENCRGRDADLFVVHDEEEKNVIDGYIRELAVPNGYWMGLRVEGGTWKWINGTNLTDASLIEPPAEGHCAVSLGTRTWTSVKCAEKRTRICSQKALSV